MTFKKLVYGELARRQLLEGINDLCEAVAVTLGPRGRTVVIENEYGSPTITKDGVTVAERIALKSIPGMGAKILQEVASKTAEDAGDGTTTATVLAHAIVVEGHKAVAAGMNPMDLKRGMDKATNAIVEELKKISIPCSDTVSIKQVGTISANADESIGNLIAEAVEKVGKEGVITIEDGTGINDELSVVEGMQFDKGYLSPNFITNTKNNTCELDNPYILIFDKKMGNAKDLLPILEACAKAGRSLLIIVDEIGTEVISVLILNHIRGVVKACVVKCPSFGEKKKAMLKDIAILLNTVAISEEIGTDLQSITLENLGTCRRVIIEKDKTTIIDGSGNKKAIEDRVVQLKSELEDIPYGYDRELLKQRIAKLAGGVAVIKVGATSESEMREKKARVDDALHATRAAIEEGIVPGGGVALIRAANNCSLSTLKGDNVDQNHGISIILKALEYPLKQIVLNAGDEPAVVVQKVKEGSGNFGYNAATSQYGDMIEMGILDPTKVTRTALQQASSVASLLITTECTISDLPKEEKEDVAKK